MAGERSSSEPPQEDSKGLRSVVEDGDDGDDGGHGDDDGDGDDGDDGGHGDDDGDGDDDDNHDDDHHDEQGRLPNQDQWFRPWKSRKPS